ADSFYSLKLTPKTGPQVMFGAEGHEYNLASAERMCNDLWDAFMRLKYLRTGKNSSFNPLQAGLSIAASLDMAIQGFRSVVPKEYDFNIDHEKHGPTEDYHFIVYRHCQGWEPFKHILPIGDVLRGLAVKNRPLHDLFLSFIRLFSQSIGIPLWDQVISGMGVDHLDERLINMESNSSPDEMQDIRDDIELYNKGMAASYGRKIRSAKRMKPVELMRRARRFKGPIAGIIYQGSELLMSSCRLWDYYYLDEYFDDARYLELDAQVTILWREYDNLYFELEEYVEAVANEGIQEPIAYFHVDRHLKSFDLEELEAKIKWPAQLAKFIESAYQVIKKFNHNERVNGKAPHQSPRPSAHCRIRC
ncbi:MAG: hypothetical protein ABUL46_04515, partial [Chitinophaga rupis]